MNSPLKHVANDDSVIFLGGGQKHERHLPAHLDKKYYRFKVMNRMPPYYDLARHGLK